MEIKPCKKVKIDTMNGALNLEIGKPLPLSEHLTISHITADFANKIIMVRDKNNMKIIFSYNYIEAIVEPYESQGMDVDNLI